MNCPSLKSLLKSLKVYHLLLGITLTLTFFLLTPYQPALAGHCESGNESSNGCYCDSGQEWCDVPAPNCEHYPSGESCGDPPPLPDRGGGDSCDDYSNYSFRRCSSDCGYEIWACNDNSDITQEWYHTGGDCYNACSGLEQPDRCWDYSNYSFAGCGDQCGYEDWTCQRDDGSIAHQSWYHGGGACYKACSGESPPEPQPPVPVPPTSVCGGDCTYSQGSACYRGNCSDGSLNCDYNYNCGYVEGCSLPSNQTECPEQLTQFTPVPTPTATLLPAPVINKVMTEPDVTLVSNRPLPDGQEVRFTAVETTGAATRFEWAINGATQPEEVAVITKQFLYELAGNVGGRFTITVVAYNKLNQRSNEFTIELDISKPASSGGPSPVSPSAINESTPSSIFRPDIPPDAPTPTIVSLTSDPPDVFNTQIKHATTITFTAKVDSAAKDPWCRWRINGAKLDNQAWPEVDSEFFKCQFPEETFHYNEDTQGEHLIELFAEDSFGIGPATQGRFTVNSPPGPAQGCSNTVDDVQAFEACIIRQASGLIEPVCTKLIRKEVALVDAMIQMMHNESGGNTCAVSTEQAVGILQYIALTWAGQIEAETAQDSGSGNRAKYLANENRRDCWKVPGDDPPTYRRQFADKSGVPGADGGTWDPYNQIVATKRMFLAGNISHWQPFSDNPRGWCNSVEQKRRTNR